MKYFNLSSSRVNTSLSEGHNKSNDTILAVIAFLFNGSHLNSSKSGGSYSRFPLNSRVQLSYKCQWNPVRMVDSRFMMIAVQRLVFPGINGVEQ